MAVMLRLKTLREFFNIYLDEYARMYYKQDDTYGSYTLIDKEDFKNKTIGEIEKELIEKQIYF